MMQPVSKRSKTFYPVALIGVARDLKEDKSMYGSTGRLFHNIEKVFVEKSKHHSTFNFSIHQHHMHNIAFQKKHCMKER